MTEPWLLQSGLTRIAIRKFLHSQKLTRIALIVVRTPPRALMKLTMFGHCPSKGALRRTGWFSSDRFKRACHLWPQFFCAPLLVRDHLVPDATRKRRDGIGLDQTRNDVNGMDAESQESCEYLQHAPSALDGLASSTPCWPPHHKVSQLIYTQWQWGAEFCLYLRLGIELTLALKSCNIPNSHLAKSS